MDEPWDTASSLDELATLATAAGIEPVRVVSQRLRSAHPRTYLGEGKAQYVADLMRAEECDLVLADDELTPAQQKGLEAVCGAGRVVDRTALILEIFGQRARTHEGLLQVQLAQARYGLPRLARLWTHLERQRGGTGTRGGAGETQIESDRRQIRARITRLERELEDVRRSRATQRAKRRDVGLSVALVGYTNAGKSTLLNRLTRGGAEVADKLFATLDPTTRRWAVAPGLSLLLTDTVGFIHKLPTGLVAAFRATLEELNEADLLLHVVDASTLHALGQAEVVLDELETLGAMAPMLTAFNKVDLLAPEERVERLSALWDRFPDGVAVSACSGEGLDLLASRAAAAVGRTADALADSVTHPGHAFGRGDEWEGPL
jgi:GTP-binding protein HflX